MNEPAEYKFEMARFFAWLPVYLLLGFALYVLSTGPFYWAIYGAYFLQESRSLQSLYLPLVWLSAVSDRFASWMDWYIGLWVL